jgi:hypothetical protein
MTLAQDIKTYAKELGADLVGIGSMDRFEGAPLQYDPRQIMPKAKSIIGLGFRIHRGLLRGMEEGTYWGGYSSMGYYKDVQGIWGWLREKVPYIRAGQESFHHPGAICGARGCMRSCLDHLDKKGVLTKKFRHPYREGKPWKFET